MLASCSRGSGDDVDVVVKLNAGMDFGTRGATWELAAAIIGKRMGIYCPTPYVVDITTEFAEIVIARDPGREALMRGSVGMNFGSEMLTGAIVWAGNMGVSSSMHDDASKVFTFDALIQNPDRSATNPNLLVRGDSIAIIDHEAAFSFLTALLRPSKAWDLGKSDFMERHALNYALKKYPVAWDLCWDAILQVDASCFEEIHESARPEWNADDDLKQIRMHIEAIADHRTEFETELRRRML